MRRVLPLLAVLLIVSCTTSSPVSIPTPTPVPSRTEIPPTTTPTNTPIPTETEIVNNPNRTNWLLLGGDYRSHRQGTQYGNKTDVIILVSVLEGYVDPYQITMIQYPRNLYIPIRNMDDQWLFSVYGREDFTGLVYYWQQAFDVDLHGIFYINMDGFVKLIDDLGGLKGRDGEKVLAYLRDNDNNWNWGGYDKEQRALNVAHDLALKVEDELTSNFFATAKVLFERWHGLIKTDVTELGQLAYLASIGWEARDGNYTIDFVQLEEPAIVRGETPLEVRGMIPATDLSEWHRDILEVR